jgi:hypothetical protein
MVLVNVTSTNFCGSFKEMSFIPNINVVGGPGMDSHARTRTHKEASLSIYGMFTMPSFLAFIFMLSSAVRKVVYENVGECCKAVLTVQVLAHCTAFNRHYVSRYVKHKTPPKDEQYGIKPTTLSSAITSLPFKI